MLSETLRQQMVAEGATFYREAYHGTRQAMFVFYRMEDVENKKPWSIKTVSCVVGQKELHGDWHTGQLKTLAEGIVTPVSDYEHMIW